MVRKENLSFISILIGSLVAGIFFSLTNFGLASAAETNLKFAVADCPMVSSGNEEESGECPNLKTIEKEGQTIVAEEGDTNASVDSNVVEQSNTSASNDRNVVEQSNTSASNDRNVVEQSDTSMPTSSGLVNPFGP